MQERHRRWRVIVVVVLGRSVLNVLVLDDTILDHQREALGSNAKTRSAQVDIEASALDEGTVPIAQQLDLHTRRHAHERPHREPSSWRQVSRYAARTSSGIFWLVFQALRTKRSFTELRVAMAYERVSERANE